MKKLPLAFLLLTSVFVLLFMCMKYEQVGIPVHELFAHDFCKDESCLT